MKIDRKFKSWFDLSEKSRNELEKHGELNALRDKGDWTEVGAYARMEKVVFLETSCVTYDLVMGAINSLLKKGFHIAIYPHWSKGIYIGFYFPECRIDFPMWEIDQFDKYIRKEIISKEEANKRCLIGWNIRCNFCGDYGAEWIKSARPGWGDLALCPQHEEEYQRMIRRHEKEKQRFRNVKYEQQRNL